MKKIIVFLSTASMLLCMNHYVYAQQNVSTAPRTISYQGYLLDAASKPLTGSHAITIKLYDAPNEGVLLHTECFTTSLQSGVFSVTIGSIQPLEPALHFDKQYWLGISVDNAGELSPRTAFASVPYAIHADAASALTKGGSGAVTTFNGRSGDLLLKSGVGTLITEEGNTFTISATPALNNGEQTQATTVNSITGTNNQVFANGTSGQKQSGDVTLTLPQNIHTNASPTFNGMTLQNFGNSGVVHNNSSGNLSSSLIGNGDVGNNANIAYSKLNLTGNIINSDIAAGANINASKLNLNNAITTGDIAAGTIMNSDINAAANISGSKLNLNNAITSGDIVAGTIMNSDINAGANISASKLNLNNAITSGDIAAGTIMNSDINAAANIADTKLATITAAGKVANSATTATPNNTANAIVHRDGSGNFSAGTITATLNGNATNVSGTVQETNGGTGTASYNKGDILYASASNNLAKRAIGNTGQVLMVNNNGVPSWSALSGVGVTSMTGTVNQVLVNGTSGVQTTGGITLTLPQDIYTGASPTFVGLTLTGKGISASTLTTDPNGTLATKDYVDNIATEYWNITGNTGLNSSTNYFGTNDATDLSLRTNGTERLKLTSDGSMLLSGASGAVPASGAGTRMEWIPSLGAIRAGMANGSEWDAASIGAQSVAMGYGTLAGGTSSVAMGFFTAAYGKGSTAMGSGTAAYVDGATAFGSASQANGVNSVAMGDNTTAWGDGSIALGSNTNSYGLYSTAMGYQTTTNANGGVAMGENLKVGLESFGFNGSTGSTVVDVSGMNNIAYFGDVDMIIGNDDNSARALKFYGSNNNNHLAGAFYSSFKAAAQTANINYILPLSQGSANTFLSNDGAGHLSWSAISALNLISGSGTTNNLAVWSSSSAVGAGSALYYDGTNNRLGIGTSSPAKTLDVSGNANVSGSITSGSTTTGGLAMSGGTAVLSYSTVAAGATITIPTSAVVVKITDDSNPNTANAVTMPSGTNGQIIYIYNNDAQATTGDITLASGAMGVFVYVDGWRKAN